MTEKQVLKKLVEIRRQKKITQKDLAKKIGIATVNLSMVERGRTILTMRRFLQICEALQVEPNKVLERVNKNPTWQEIFMDIVKNLLPEEIELLVGVAQMMSDRHDLRP